MPLESTASTTTLREESSSYAIAVDLGTTQIRVSLWDTNRQERIAIHTILNPQAKYGNDVLSRLTYAIESSEQALEISNLVRHAIGEALKNIASAAGAKLKSIVRMLIVGNTAMLSLLAGKNFQMLLDPKNNGVRVAADKALILRVKVPSHQLLDSDA